jgi:glycosyltransferase involved in cell wall biosynthesis
MKPQKVMLVAAGDPEKSSTWSGTPKAIVNSLRQAGHDVIPINAIPSSKNYKAFLLMLHWARYRNIYFRDTRFYNRACQRKVIAALNSEAIKNPNIKIIHMGTHALGSLLNRWSEFSTVFLDYPRSLQQKFGARRTHDKETLEVERSGLEAVKGIFVTGKYAADSLIADYGLKKTKTRVVGTGFNSFLSEITKSQTKLYDRKNILFASKIRSGWVYKGGADLLRAFEIIKNRIPDASLTIVGSESNKQYVEGVSGAMGFGYVGSSELAKLYAQASVFCMPARAEPWGLVYLEALSTATPVIGSLRMGFAEIYDQGRCGWAVSPGDIDGLVAVLEVALRNPEVLRQKGEYGREYVARYNWRGVAEKLLEDAF